MSTIEPRTAVVTIYQGDYLDRIRHLERKAEAAMDAGGSTPKRSGERPEHLRLAEEHDALVAEAEESALQVKVQAIRRSAWKALLKEHPPRDGNKSDEALGVNEDTFKDALVAFVNENDPEDRTIVEPLGLDVDRLADADYDRLYYAAFGLNRGVAAAPKASLVSRMTQQNSETSD